jgi:hypothetical protein
MRWYRLLGSYDSEEEWLEASCKHDKELSGSVNEELSDLQLLKEKLASWVGRYMGRYVGR